MYLVFTFILTGSKTQEKAGKGSRDLKDFSLTSCEEDPQVPLSRRRPKLKKKNHLNFLEQEWPRRHKAHCAGDKTLESIYIQVKII